MTEPICVSVRRGIMKIEGQLHLASGVHGIEQFINALEVELLGCARQKGAIVIELPSPAAAPTHDDIPRTGLLNKRQMMRLFNVSRSTLDKYVQDGIIPAGGKRGAYRVWDAEPMWELAKQMALTKAPPKEASWLKKKPA